MIKILTGWSNPGGSTTAHINLCKLFNEGGLECKLYGPHEWHLDKVPSGKLQDVNIQPTDSVIVHFLDLDFKPRCKKIIYSCHETNLKPIRTTYWNVYDYVHYVSESQRKWHNRDSINWDQINYPSVIIPNVLDDLKPNPKGKETFAGIIGSVDCHKQTHLSIQRALEDGHDKIVLCGELSDPYYWEERIRPLEDKHPGKIFHIGYQENKQNMYDCLHEVYHSSLRETFNLVKAECQLTNTKYNGLPSADTDGEYWPKEKILEAWKQVLL